MYSNTRVLIVDDNPSIRDDYRRILCPSASGLEDLEQIEAVLFDEMRNHKSKLRPNFQTAFASQGEQAEILAKAAIEQGVPFAVAIVDIRMPPGMDGVETVKRLWQVQSELQIILCTAYSDYSWQEIVEQLGASHRLVILKKPFDPIEVLQLCQAMCIKWVAEREMAFRQIELQSSLMRTSLSAEKLAGELYQERGLRAELNQKRSDAEILDVMSGLASSISHDFNNALTVIQGHLSSALLTPSGLAATLPMEQMLEAAERASLLSRQMMALTSEVETPSDMQVFNVLPVITKQIEMMRRVLKEKAHIGLYYSDSEHFIYASESLLTRLLNVMVIRAQEQMSRGGNLNITLTTQSSLDTPSGVQQMMVQVSFEMAPRADTSKAHQELSEGMTAALKLSENLGGKLLLNVDADLACVMSLSLPKADPNQPQEAMQRIVAARNIASNIDKQLTFMVVDDERSICDILGYILGNQGHKVLKAQTAMEAWTLWQSNRHGIDMVISDIYLPDGLTGYDLASSLRESAPDLPIIYMSGYQPCMISGGEELIVGVNYLTKPFDVLDLLNAVTRTLETGRQMPNLPLKPLHTSALATNTGNV
ncbi:MAG: response regulator [Verrucomicrobia bacterium]|nr:response regulator [Verrucomicrobiota bacterium]